MLELLPPMVSEASNTPQIDMIIIDDADLTLQDTASGKKLNVAAQTTKCSKQWADVFT